MCQMLHIFLAISCELGLEQLALWFRDTWPALLCVLGVWGRSSSITVKLTVNRFCMNANKALKLGTKTAEEGLRR